MRPAELEQIVDHRSEPVHLVLDRLELRGARTRALTLSQDGRVRPDHGQRVAEVVAHLRDVEPALAIEVAQAMREMLERAGHPPDLAAAGDELDVALALADPQRGLRDRLEVLAMTPARALEQANADENEHETDRSQPLCLDQEEIAVDVLRGARDGERAA